MRFKKLAARELLSVRQHLLIPHFLAGVRVVQKSPMFLHMRMEKAAGLPVGERNTCPASEPLSPPRGMCCRDTNSSAVTPRRSRTRASAPGRRSVFAEAASLRTAALVRPSSPRSAAPSRASPAAARPGLSGALVT